jgi:hypothetical protein
MGTRLRRTVVSTVALVLPLGVIAAVGGPTFFAGAKTAIYPVMCNVSATVTFSPPLVKGGIDTVNKADNEVTTVSGITFTNCVSSNTIGAPTSGTASDITVNTAPAKGAKVSGIQHYIKADCGQFTSPTTLKQLKGGNVTVTWSGQPAGWGATGTTTELGNGASLASNAGGEVGFNLLGNATGDYAGTTKPYPSQTTAYIVNNATSANLLGGCNSGPVSSITIDASTSTAIF